jgi:uncharacterized membrane protein SirB2
MSEFYAEIKLVHVLCVALSGSLFTLRGTLMLAASPLANHAVLRHASYVIDTVLLTAALTLVAILHQYPFVQPWLTAKVLLLVAYIVLGVFALRRGRTRTSRALFFAAALAVFLFIVSVALAHDPHGIFILISSRGSG